MKSLLKCPFTITTLLLAMSFTAQAASNCSKVLFASVAYQVVSKSTWNPYGMRLSLEDIANKSATGDRLPPNVRWVSVAITSNRNDGSTTVHETYQVVTQPGTCKISTLELVE